MQLRYGAALLAATVLAATPAMARDKTLYLGIEAGPSWASELDLDLEIDDTETDFLEVDHKMGYDVGLIFGYDAGFVRAELDLSYKRWSHDEYSLEDDGVTVIDGDGSTRYVAIMTNLLLDMGDEDGFSFYAGPGAGFAWGKFDIDDGGGGDDDAKDGGFAWQAVAGARYALNPNVDLGLKYRYFHPSRVTEGFDADGDGDNDFGSRGKMHSHSLLATLTYNFYTPEPPPPPPMVPPPPPPPATQTCPDGSVILATDSCPPPPPPPHPPPPAPEPERG